MQYADKVNCKSEVFSEGFFVCLGFFLLMPMWCMMKCRVSLLKSSILLNALSNIGEKSPFEGEAVCKFVVYKE